MAVGVKNSTGTTQTQDYNLGRGVLYIAALDGTTGLPGPYRDLGNAPSFALNVSVEELIHQSSRASPGGGTAGRAICTCRFVLVTVPDFSAKADAGRITSAKLAVSVRKMSCTTR